MKTIISILFMARTPAVLKQRTAFALRVEHPLEAHEDRLGNTTQRTEEVLDDFRKAFAGFSEDELAVLDGVMLEPLRGRCCP